MIARSSVAGLPGQAGRREPVRRRQGEGRMADNRTVILTVIADASDRAAVARVLRGEGFEVREATTGKEALALAAGNPALIVLDINLPDMSGYEVGRRLKGDPATADTAVVSL